MSDWIFILNILMAPIGVVCIVTLLAYGSSWTARISVALCMCASMTSCYYAILERSVPEEIAILIVLASLAYTLARYFTVRDKRTPEQIEKDKSFYHIGRRHKFARH